MAAAVSSNGPTAVAKPKAQQQHFLRADTHPRFKSASFNEEDNNNWTIPEPTPDICAQFIEFETLFDLGKQIGEGNYSTVHRCTEKATGNSFAAKVTLKAKRGVVSAVKAELAALKLVNHPNIVRFVSVYESHSKYFLVTELVEGVDLLPKILNAHQYFSEFEASAILTQLLSAMQHAHSLGVIHCDLKPQNMVYTNAKDHRSLKVVDFGSALVLKPGETATRVAGTMKFMAPEMISKKPYTSKIDMWSIGVILYIMLCGSEPFPYEGGKLTEAIKKGTYYTGWDYVSADAVSLLKSLLQLDPKKRLSAEEALAHPWLQAPPQLVTGAGGAGVGGRRLSTAPSTPLPQAVRTNLDLLHRRLSQQHQQQPTTLPIPEVEGGTASTTDHPLDASGSSFVNKTHERMRNAAYLCEAGIPQLLNDWLLQVAETRPCNPVLDLVDFLANANATITSTEGPQSPTS